MKFKTIHTIKIVLSDLIQTELKYLMKHLFQVYKNNLIIIIIHQD